ncbi:MAG: thioredoxin family protein [Vulcanimicrobiaceae bacterium]
METSLPQITSETFQAQVIESSNPVIVDFWGPRCVRCKQLDPLVSSLATQYSQTLTIFKAIAPEDLALCRKYSVAGLPAFLAFHEGVEVERISGEVASEDVRAFVERIASL